MVEYLQRLQDKATLLEEAEGSQVIGSKCKKITAGDKDGQWPPKNVRRKQPGKYYGGAAVKMGDANPYERCVSARQDCLVYHSR